METFKILFLKQNTVFWGKMATDGRKRYFQRDSDTEFIAEEEITQAASTQGTSLATPQVNLHVAPSDNQLKKKK